MTDGPDDPDKPDKPGKPGKPDKPEGLAPPDDSEGWDTPETPSAAPLPPVRRGPMDVPLHSPPPKQPGPPARSGPMDVPLQPQPPARSGPMDVPLQPKPPARSRPTELEALPSARSGPTDVLEPLPSARSGPTDVLEPLPSARSGPTDVLEPLPSARSGPVNAPLAPASDTPSVRVVRDPTLPSVIVDDASSSGSRSAPIAAPPVSASSDDLMAELRDAAGVSPLAPVSPLPDANKTAKELAKEAKDRAKAAKEEKKRLAREKRDRGDGDRDNDDDLADRGSVKTPIFVAASIVLGLGIGAFAFFGYRNSSRYYIACEADQVLAKQGRSFPPWGTRTLDDAAWKPIKIPPGAECRDRDTDDEYELSGWFLEILRDRASNALSGRDAVDPAKVGDAAKMLEQALLHARTPERRDQRKELERLLGDVGYWQASAKLQEAAKNLGDAAKQFDEAAAQRPRHVSDASAWATYARKLADELKAGPSGVKTTPFAPSTTQGERPLAPPGVALPVEPDTTTPSEPPPVTTPDAGVPSGGVLL